MLRVSDVDGVINHFYQELKGENALKLDARIKDYYVGISRLSIQTWINSNRDHCKKNAIFDNKGPLKPVVAKVPMERCQIDLVVKEKSPSVSRDGKVYYNILSVIDVFSRFLFLRALETKESLEVVNRLKEIFMVFGNPRIIQSDGGSEFKGLFVIYYNELYDFYKNLGLLYGKICLLNNKNYL